MTRETQAVLREALKLDPVERAELVEGLLASFDFPDRAEIDEAWAREVEQRIDAYERGEMKSSPAEAVFARIRERLRS